MNIHFGHGSDAFVTSLDDFRGISCWCLKLYRCPFLSPCARDRPDGILSAAWQQSRGAASGAPETNFFLHDARVSGDYLTVLACHCWRGAVVSLLSWTALCCGMIHPPYAASGPIGSSFASDKFQGGPTPCIAFAFRLAANSARVHVLSRTCLFSCLPVSSVQQQRYRIFMSQNAPFA